MDTKAKMRFKDNSAETRIINTFIQNFRIYLESIFENGFKKQFLKTVFENCFNVL